MGWCSELPLATGARREREIQNANKAGIFE